MKTMICLNNGKQATQTHSDDEDGENSGIDDDTPAQGDGLKIRIPFAHDKNLTDRYACLSD
jgi:hypothetical protein